MSNDCLVRDFLGFPDALRRYSAVGSGIFGILGIVVDGGSLTPPIWSTTLLPTMSLCLDPKDNGGEPSHRPNRGCVCSWSPRFPILARVKTYVSTLWAVELVIKFLH